MRRKPDPEQRRRELCDAGVRLLAQDGVKGVSHLKVDRNAGVPDGTTSFYFRTRAALLQATAARVAELDLKDLAAATKLRTQVPDDEGVPHPTGLATLVVRAASGARRTRAKARNELALEAGRDPMLAEALRGYNDEFFGLIRDAVRELQPGDRNPEPGDIDQQAFVVMMFISGVLLSLSSGDQRICTATELDALISGIVAGVGCEPASAGSPSVGGTGRRDSVPNSDACARRQR